VQVPEKMSLSLNREDCKEAMSESYTEVKKMKSQTLHIHGLCEGRSVRLNPQSVCV